MVYHTARLALGLGMQVFGPYMKSNGGLAFRSLKTESGKMKLVGGLVAYDCHMNTPGTLPTTTEAEHELAVREHHYLVADQVIDLMSCLGVRNFDDLAGRYDLLGSF